MTRFDIRYFRRHPAKWVRHWWLHLLVSATLAVLGAVWDQPIFEQVVVADLWPLFVAALVLASALAPFERRLQAVTGASLVTLGVFRAVAMAEVLYVGQANRAVVASLACHAILIAALGVIWPTWTAACGSAATVEAGDDDRGARGAV